MKKAHWGEPQIGITTYRPVRSLAIVAGSRLFTDRDDPDDLFIVYQRWRGRSTVHLGIISRRELEIGLRIAATATAA